MSRLTCALAAASLIGPLAWLARPAPVHRWSDPATWGGSVPRAGADAVIPEGEAVVLDVSPPPLHSLDVRGALSFADRDLTLSAGAVTVSGRLQIGSEARPFTRRAALTLLAAPGGDECLSVTGTLELHGRADGQRGGPTWTRLDGTAASGARRVRLADAPAWRPGDRIVLASTDYDPAEAEEATVAAASGRDVTLATPLRFSHWGRITDGVDERAEVGLLSHNIVISGDPGAAGDGMGGQVMVMRGGAARVAGVEMTRMGRRGRMGAYPFHFHRAGDQAGSYLRGCSLHGCYNRAVTLHGTDGVLVQDNVAYDTVGHCFFLEDGCETGNALIHNLGLRTRRARPGAALLPSDLSPATFWVTNPANVLRGNAAAGSDGDGFWYSLPARVSGLSRTPETDRIVSPRRTALGEFRDNAAHSNARDGLFVDNGPNPAGVSGAPNYDPPQEAVFDGLTAWKNRRRGAWLRGSRLALARARLADDSVGATFAASRSVLRDSLVVGQTANVGPPASRLPKPEAPHTPRVGFEFYDGLVGVQDTVFRHFRPASGRPAGALSYVRYTPFFVDPRNWARGLRFEDAVPVYFAPPPQAVKSALGADGYRSASFLDLDGSVSGHPGRAVAVPSPLLGAATAGPGVGSVLTAAPLGRLFIDSKDARPAAVGPVTVSGGRGRGLTLYGSPPDGGMPAKNFGVVLPTGRAYAVRFAHAAPARLRLTLRFCPPGSWVRVLLPGHAPVSLVVPAGADTASAEVRGANRGRGSE